jgi:nucleotide-binding universal stress UspA family protein
VVSSPASVAGRSASSRLADGAPKRIYSDLWDTPTMRVLIPHDGSEQADEAIAHAASEHADDEIVLLHVLDFVEAGYNAAPDTVVPGYWDEWYEEAEENGQELLAERAATFDGEVETAVVVGRPVNAILEYTAENGIDMIVMGSHGRDGISRVLLGSVAEAVVRRSPVPVTVVR